MNTYLVDGSWQEILIQVIDHTSLHTYQRRKNERAAEEKEKAPLPPQKFIYIQKGAEIETQHDNA